MWQRTIPIATAADAAVTKTHKQYDHPLAKLREGDSLCGIDRAIRSGAQILFMYGIIPVDQGIALYDVRFVSQQRQGFIGVAV